MISLRLNLIFCSIVFSIISLCGYGQDDLGVVTINSQIVSGCDLGSTQISVDVFNYSTANYSGAFDVTYQLDNDAPVTQSSLNVLGFGSNDTRTINFLANLDLTNNYGVHKLKAFTSVNSDVDRTNDTISITFTNFEPTEAGLLEENKVVCQSANTDTLFLSNKIGDVIEWQLNTGSGWSPLLVTDTFYVFNNLTTTTMYRVKVQNGTCAEELSNEVTVQVDPPAEAGTLGDSKVICLGDDGDTLRLTGFTGTVQMWQMNDNGTWVDVVNDTDSLVYGTLTTTTLYRAIVEQGVCAPDTSNIVEITVLPVSEGGTIMSSATVCATGNQDTLRLANFIGDVQRWEFSDDGNSWVPFITTDTFLVYSNLTANRMYRAFVQSATCPAVYSDTATITVDEAADAGTLEESNVICQGSGGDTLRLQNYTGSIDKWEVNDGSGWVTVVNTTDTMTYGALTTTTSYRVIVTSGVCDPDTSNVAVITVVSGTVGGTIIESDSVCSGINMDTLVLANSLGNILQWESSDDDGFTWMPIVNTDTFLIYNNLTATRNYRVLVQANGCNSEYSDTATIEVIPAPLGGMVEEDKSICGGANQDTLFLVGYSGDIVMWQENNNGTWVDIANTSDTLVVMNVTSTTSYRAIVGNGGFCPNDTSTIATLTVISTTLGGNIIESDSVCLGVNNDTLNLVGHVGDIRWWERSTDDGISWSPVINMTTSQIYNNITETIWYRVLVEGTSCPNQYSDTAMITVYEPEVSITALDTTTFCEGDSVRLNATPGYVDYLWSTDDTTEFVIAKETDTYKVTITDMRGCQNSDSIDVTVNPLPIAEAGEDVTISLGSSTILEGEGGEFYLWSPGMTLDDVNLQSPEASPLETTQYTLLVTDLNGCQSKDSVTVSVERDFDFSPKNVITPNGDGHNDFWKVDNLIAYPDCEVLIMNRYGEVIFETSGYNNTWDGRTADGTISDGTYYYVITCDGTEEVFKGHITVLSK